MGNLNITRKPLISQIIFMSLYFYYIYDLQKKHCKCIDNDINYLIQKLYILQLILLVIITLMKLNKEIRLGLLVINIIVTLYIIINIYKFVNYMEKDNCDCAESISKTLIKYTNILNIIMVFYLFIELVYDVMISLNKKIHK